MFSDSIKKMAFSQLVNWMKKEDIAELKVFIQNGNLEFEEIKKPDFYIKNSDLEIYKKEFTRLRREISLREEEITTLKTKTI
jgi:hypothetical protein